MRRISGTISFFLEVSKIIIFSLLFVVPVRYFIFQPFVVRGESMVPNFHQNDYLIIDELSYRFRGPHRGEAIVFRFPRDPRQHYIKRIVGLPGETVAIEDGKIFIEKDIEKMELQENYLVAGQLTQGSVRITLDENDYFVLGDNRGSSSDSRTWGPLPQSFITGRVLFRAWPVANVGFIEAPIH